MTMPYRDRALEDILEAERQLRETAEHTAREYRSLVVELAQRLAGAALEERRRENPNLPQGWSAEDWRAFWWSVMLRRTTGWKGGEEGNGKGNGHEALERTIARLEQELAGMRQRLEAAQAEIVRERQAREALEKRLSEARAKPKEGKDKGQGPAKREAGVILSPEELPETHRRFVEKLKALTVPAAPLAYRERLKPENALRYRRKALILYTLAQSGFSTRMEIDRVISVTEHLSERTNSVRTPADELVTAGLLVNQTIRMLSPFETGLAVVRLSEDGKALCRTWGWEVVESEWERILRLHQGAEQEAHTVMLLAFALHARLRGWNASVLPEVDGTNAVPDALVERDGERWYVEVERGDGSRRKWKNLAALNGGKVALCAADEEGRAKLVRDCKAERLGGVAADLRTLIFDGDSPRKMVEITPTNELWMEGW